MSITKRLEALEARTRSTDTPKTLIATQIIATDDAALHGQHTTVDNIVTFYGQTLMDAYKLREVYLADQTDVIALMSPFENGDHVLSVLEEKHGKHWLDDAVSNPETVLMTEAQLIKVAMTDE